MGSSDLLRRSMLSVILAGSAALTLWQTGHAARQPKPSAGSNRLATSSRYTRTRAGHRYRYHSTLYRTPEPPVSRWDGIARAWRGQVALLRRWTRWRVGSDPAPTATPPS